MKSVLIVDDSRVVRLVIREILQQAAEFNVLGEAEDGHQGVEMALALGPDQVTLDIEMPVMDGIEALRRLRVLSPAHILVLSSLTHPASPKAVEARLIGADAVVGKPSGSLGADLSEMGEATVLPVMRRLGERPTIAQPGEQITNFADLLAEAPAVEFFATIQGALSVLSAALEQPASRDLDGERIPSAVSALGAAAAAKGYFGIAATCAEIGRAFDGGARPEKMNFTWKVCDLVLRLRLLSDLSAAPVAMEQVHETLAPHIAQEARSVLTNLEEDENRFLEWEFLAVLARALDLPGIAALTRLASELTALPDWSAREGATEVVREIIGECQVLGVEGVDIRTLDVFEEDYEQIRQRMSLLLTNTGTGEVGARERVGPSLFDRFSPSARDTITRALRVENTHVLELALRLPDDDPATAATMGRILGEQVVHNELDVESSADRYTFYLCVEGSAEDLLDRLGISANDSQREVSCRIIT